MSQIEDRNLNRNLTDFVYGATEASKLEIEIAINDDGRCIVFHNKPFKEDVSWFEFNLENNKLDFILEDGDIRDLGLPVAQNVSKHMQNTHQILMVLLDSETGDAKEGKYIPLIIHRS